MVSRTSFLQNNIEKSQRLTELWVELLQMQESLHMRIRKQKILGKEKNATVIIQA